MASYAAADDRTILAGIADIPRLHSTGPIDGCAKVQRGLINSGGFMLFTCEKLLPHYSISEHQSAFEQYKSVIRANGWTTKSISSEKAEFYKTDVFGCKTHLDVNIWRDRSMNEPRRASSDRNAHRQIVFKAKLYGSACDQHFAQAKHLARSYP